jgi:hypothetical protein
MVCAIPTYLSKRNGPSGDGLSAKLHLIPCNLTAIKPLLLALSA